MKRHWTGLNCRSLNWIHVENHKQSCNGVPLGFLAPNSRTRTIIRDVHAHKLLYMFTGYNYKWIRYIPVLFWRFFQKSKQPAQCFHTWTKAPQWMDCACAKALMQPSIAQGPSIQHCSLKPLDCVCSCFIVSTKLTEADGEPCDSDLLMLSHGMDITGEGEHLSLFPEYVLQVSFIYRINHVT